MRTLLGGIVAGGMLLSTFTVAGAATVHKQKSASKTAAQKSTGTASRSAPTSSTKTGTAHSATARRTGKKGTPATTWRNRQLAPTPQRYKEIQDALVAKGYLKPEDATGGWNQNSMDALKRFQSEQNIESTGKINSLSLIALGLGPKRDAAPPKPAVEPIQTDR